MRDTQRGVIGGVAAGFGEYLDVDPVLVRLGFVLLAFVHGLGLLFYLVCWLVMPRRDAPAVVPGFAAPREAASRLVASARSADTSAAQAAVGSLLVLVGALLLAHNLDWLEWPRWLRFDTLWPLLLVALGAGLIARSRRPAAAVPDVGPEPPPPPPTAEPQS